MHFYACWHETPATKHFQNCLIYCDCCCLFFLSLLLLLSRATRGIMANIVVDVFYFTPLFHIYLFIYFIGSFGCVCVCACSHVSDWHEACMYVCMYACIHVTARSGPLYVCVMYVSRCMCARGRQACSSRSSASKP